MQDAKETASLRRNRLTCRTTETPRPASSSAASVSATTSRRRNSRSATSTAQSAISRIECDRISPTVDTLSGLLRALGEELSLETRPGRPVVLRARVLDSEGAQQTPATDTARSA